MTVLHVCFSVWLGVVVAVLPFSAVSEEQRAVPEISSTSVLSARPILLGAHRCGRSEWPENTLVAVGEAANLGPDVLLEIDAQTTADGQVVVIHDYDVDRTTDGTGFVGMMSFEEIRTLDAAYHFSPDDGLSYPYRGKGVVIPTLEEALQSAPAHRFLIELKDGTAVGKAAAEAIRKAGASDRCIIASTNPAFIEELRACAPEIATCYDLLSAADMIGALRKNRWEDYTPQHRMLALSPSLGARFALTRDEIIKMRGKGILICYFTVNDPAEMEEILKMGVDSILTDRPSLLASVIQKMHAHGMADKSASSEKSGESEDIDK